MSIFAILGQGRDASCATLSLGWNDLKTGKLVVSYVSPLRLSTTMFLTHDTLLCEHCYHYCGEDGIMSVVHEGQEECALMRRSITAAKINYKLEYKSIVRLDLLLRLQCIDRHLCTACLGELKEGFIELLTRTVYSGMVPGLDYRELACLVQTALSHEWISALLSTTTQHMIEAFLATPGLMADRVSALSTGTTGETSIMGDGNNATSSSSGGGGGGGGGSSTSGNDARQRQQPPPVHLGMEERQPCDGSSDAAIGDAYHNSNCTDCSNRQAHGIPEIDDNCCDCMCDCLCNCCEHWCASYVIPVIAMCLHHIVLICDRIGNDHPYLYLYGEDFHEPPPPPRSDQPAPGVHLTR